MLPVPKLAVLMQKNKQEGQRSQSERGCSVRRGARGAKNGLQLCGKPFARFDRPPLSPTPAVEYHELLSLYKKVQIVWPWAPFPLLTSMRRAQFQEVDAEGAGKVSRDQFLELPFLAANPLRDAIARMVRFDEAGLTTFKDMVMTLSTFSEHGSRDRKLRGALQASPPAPRAFDQPLRARA